ncbi:MAG: hypothetical protein WAX89_05705 [Alphaproteobacteria bacterium]
MNRNKLSVVQDVLQKFNELWQALCTLVYTVKWIYTLLSILDVIFIAWFGNILNSSISNSNYWPGIVAGLILTSILVGVKNTLDSESLSLKNTNINLEKKNAELQVETEQILTLKAEVIHLTKKYRDFVAAFVLKDVFDGLVLSPDERVTAYVVYSRGLNGFCRPLGRYSSRAASSKLEKEQYSLYLNGDRAKPYGCIGSAFHEGVDEWVVDTELPENPEDWILYVGQKWNIPREKAEKISMKAGSIMAICVGGRSGYDERMVLAIESEKRGQFKGEEGKRVKAKFDRKMIQDLKKALDADRAVERQLLQEAQVVKWENQK